MTKKRSKALIIIVSVLILAIIGTVLTVVIINNNSKKDFLPFELKQESIQKIELYKLNIKNGTPEETSVVLNQKDTKKAISDIKKLKRTDNKTDIMYFNNGQDNDGIGMKIYTNSGVVRLVVRAKEQNKNIYVLFDMFDFKNAYDYDNMKNIQGTTVEFLTEGVTKNSILRMENMSLIFDEYKNGTRKQ